MNCTHNFTSKKIVDRHEPNCLEVNGSQAVDIPKYDIEFKNFKNTLDVPFVIYVDMEVLVEPLDINKANSSQTIQ